MAKKKAPVETPIEPEVSDEQQAIDEQTHVNRTTHPDPDFVPKV